MSEILDNQQKTILNILSCTLNESINFNQDSFLTFTESDLKELYLESIAHAVSLMVFDRLSVCKDKINKEIYSEWKNSCAVYLRNNLKVTKGESELFKLLENNGFSFAVLKGSASSKYYNKGDLRISGDVDFLVKKEDVVSITNLLITNGYVKGRDDHPNHVVFEKNKVFFELHFEVAGIPYGKIGESLNEYIDKNYIIGSDNHIPNDICHGLILILHMQHHLLGEGIGLRHLYDFATFVQKTANKDFWVKELLPLLKETGLYTFTMAMINTVVKFLSVDEPAWAIIGDNKLSSELIIDVFNAGNFGRKDKNRAGSGMLISEHGKGGTTHSALYNLSHSLHKAVLRMPIVKKCIFLYPFVYAYKVIKFCFLSLIGKRPSLIKMAPEAKKRKSIYDKLKVFEVEDKEK